MEIKSGDVLIYLGGDTFLDKGMKVGNRYTVSQISDYSYDIDEITRYEIKSASFIESNFGCHLQLIDKYFKFLSEEREETLKSLLN